MGVLNLFDICIRENHLNETNILSSEVLKPVVTVNPTELEDTVGQTIVFQCNVQGPGPFNVIWSRIDGQGLPNRAQVGPRYSLTIRDVQETDAGRYVCTATNVHGSNRQYVNLIVLGRYYELCPLAGTLLFGIKLICTRKICRKRCLYGNLCSLKQQT